jgi:hypothetical protein
MTQPHWPTFITILAVLGLDAALPSTLRLGPQWLFSSIAFALAMAHFVSYAAKRPRLSTILGFAVDGLLALQLVLSLILLIRALPAHKQTPHCGASARIRCI